MKSPQLTYFIFKSQNRKLFVLEAISSDEIESPPIFEIYLDSDRSQLLVRKTIFYDADHHNQSVIDPILASFNTRKEWNNRTIHRTTLSDYLESNDFKKLTVQALLKAKR